jgi:hypothetical protein
MNLHNEYAIIVKNKLKRGCDWKFNYEKISKRKLAP